MIAETQGKKTVLVIEDDPFLSDLLSSALTEEGVSVEHAADAESGLEMLRTKSIAIVLLDIILPGMDGYEFLKQVKADPSIAQTPVFVLSNLGQKDEIDRAISMGAEAFLVKAQLDLSEIVDRVKELLGQSGNAAPSPA